jgi:hypothetical protein
MKKIIVFALLLGAFMANSYASEPTVGSTLSNPPGDYSSCSGCTTTYLGNDAVSLTCTSCIAANGSKLKATALIPYTLYQEITKVWNQNGQIAITYSTLPGTTYVYGQA